MKLKKVVLFLSLMMIVFLLAGCIHSETEIELNSDSTGKLVFTQAVNTDISDPDEIEELNSAESIKSIEGVKITNEPLQYEENGYNYAGQKTTVAFSNIEKFFDSFPRDENGERGFELITLPNGNKRFECYVDFGDTGSSDDVSDEEGIDFDVDFLSMIQAAGGKIIYTIKTDYNVVDHNADKVENGVYTWDLLQQATDPENTEKAFTLFIEYATADGISADDNTPVTEKNEKRTAVVKKLGLNRNDKDFYGKALNKLGILNGTDKGLELDKGLTRAEGAMMYSRLLGLDDEIAEFKKENPDYKSGFTDVPGWVEPTINYLHYNKLINGIGQDKYGSNDLMTEAQYAALVLRALGYDDSKGDFVWNKASEKLNEIGFYDDDIISPESALNGAFTRRGMAYISYNALFFPSKSTGGLLIDKLME